jgi:uncharacterized protein
MEEKKPCISLGDDCNVHEDRCIGSFRRGKRRWRNPLRSLLAERGTLPLSTWRAERINETMKPLLEVTATNQNKYERQLQAYLPGTMIDIHTHVWLNQFQTKDKDECLRAVTWPQRVAMDNSIEDLQETYRPMFPDKRVMPLIFGTALSPQDNLKAGNEYVRKCAQELYVPALIFADPTWSAAEFEERICAGHFLGAKVYLTRSDPKIAENNIQIHNFLPRHQLKVLDKRGWIGMLHIPRRERLRDRVDLMQMVEIEKNYPKVKVIIAHVGRAYSPKDAGDAIEVLAETRRMMFDISANTSAEKFERLIRAVGPQRILFGSDLPIVRARTGSMRFWSPSASVFAKISNCCSAAGFTPKSFAPFAAVPRVIT